MIEFLQNPIRFIWQPFLFISMPWQSAIMLFLFVLFIPWLVIRAFPWLLYATFKMLLAFIWFSFERFLWLDYHMSTKKRRDRGREPLLFSYILGDLLRGILLNLSEIVIRIKSLQRNASQLRVFLTKKRCKLYLLPLIAPLIVWFITPVLGADSQVIAVNNSSVEFWCSMENWAMTGKMNTPYFGCHYPGKEPPLISNYRKTREYKLINQKQKYDRVIENNPENPELYYKRGSVYLEKGNIDLALQDYNKALNLNTDYAPGYKGRGDVYLAGNDKDSAYKEYSVAISKDPNYAPGYKGRGDVYLAGNDKDSAYKEYSVAISKDPNYAPGYKGRGDVYLAGNDYKAAFKEYNKSIKNNPGYALGYFQLGKIYANNLNKQNLAIKSYRIAANIFRKYGDDERAKFATELIKEIDSKQ